MASEQHTIDGVTIHVTTLPPLDALEILPRVLALISPVLGALKSGQVSGESDAFDLLDPLTGALRTLPKGDLVSTVSDLFRGVMVERGGKRIALDKPERINGAFQGKILTMLKCAACAAKVQFADFLPHGLDGLDAEPQAVE